LEKIGLATDVRHARNVSPVTSPQASRIAESA
jgi:hypothetical protein